MANAQNRTFRWSTEKYAQSKAYAADVLDMTWSEYVKELLIWEQETGGFAQYRARGTEKTPS